LDRIPAIKKAGTQPIAAEMARIAALKSRADIAAHVAAEHRTGIDTNVLFGFDAEPDLDHSKRMKANPFAGGLGLPDRDYYTKTDAKSVEIRQRYLQHVAQSLRLFGGGPKQAKAGAVSVLAIETKLARATLTGVEQRDPYKLKNRFTREELIAFTPHFDWQTYWTDMNLPPFKDLNLGGTILAYLAWTRATANADLQPIDGLTPDQRFFVGMAQWGCGFERSEEKRVNATVNPHSPNEFRVNGVVSNIPDFGKAFGCREGQPMMRANACRVW
jgi:predicted metalloendopeptidase